MKPNKLKPEEMKKHKMKFSNTSRMKNSAIINMQHLLNKDSDMSKAPDNA